MEGVLRSIINSQSSIPRLALIVLLAVAVFAIGHWGLRGIVADSGASGPGGAQMQFGPTGSRDAADVPPPPLSERAFSQTARRGPERALAAYTSRADPAAVIAFYRTMMPPRGWAERSSGPVAGDSGGTELQYSNKAKDLCMITVSEAPSGGSYVMIFRWPAAHGK